MTPNSSQHALSLALQKIGIPLLLGLIFLGAWQAFVVVMDLPPYLVPSPVLMVQTLVSDWQPFSWHCG